MKRKMKIFISCILVLGMLIGTLGYLGRLTERKDSREKYEDFFRQEADFDVLFLGSSHMMNAVLPMELWNDYGIVSYNMGGHGSSLGVSYWMLRNALDYTTPKMVVVDCLGVYAEYLINPKFEYMHQSFDAFPLSVNKVRMIRELVQDSEEGADDKMSRRMALAWNFTTYHNRWSELKENDFNYEISPEKGAQIRINVASPNETAFVAPEEKTEMKTIGMQYLRRIVEDCKDMGIKVVLTYLPFPAQENRILESRVVQDFAEENGVEYLNFLEMDIVNFNTDMFDPDSHLNPSGAHKVTGYIGQILREQYQIADHRGDEEYSDWHEDWQEYFQFKLGKLQEQSSGYRYLMLLSDSDYSFLLELNRWDTKQDEVYAELLENLGIDCSRLSEDVCYVAVDRVSDTVEYISRAELEAGPVETQLGTFCIRNDDTTYSLVLEGSAAASVEYEKRMEFDYRALVYDKDGNFLAFSQLNNR